MKQNTTDPETFEILFFDKEIARLIRVPDYQRAYSWEQKQIELFIKDLVEYQGSKGYYFGHFIAENIAKESEWKGWEIVDGQQRVTTFVLFLMICQLYSSSGSHAPAYSLIDQFATVSYDSEALETIRTNLAVFLEKNPGFRNAKPPADEELIRDLELKGDFTRSQRKMAVALLLFHKAFQDETLEKGQIGAYIAVIMNAYCSLHLATDKSVAVNIFEMHNTRGVPLTTLEIIKAMLMKFVYDHGGSQVEEIQREFGEIYGMEELLAASSFRGEMTMEQLLHLHLRVVDDGNKRTWQEFDLPRMNAGSETLVEYVNSMLHFTDGDKTKPERTKKDGVQYAINLAKEFKKSVQIVSKTLPEWDADEKNRLVGDVLILERDLSCELFLVTCRILERETGKADGRISDEALSLWEKLLFTRDFHGEYYNLKGSRDDFPSLFAVVKSKEESVSVLLKRYLTDGFRPYDRTKGLQSKVALFLNDERNRNQILNNAFYWWKHKMIYAIYKFEISQHAEVRKIVKRKISVEHILPQEWDWNWIEKSSQYDRALSPEEKEEWLKGVGSFINGIGNLLLLNPGSNTTLGNNHPAEKNYTRYCIGGSYEEHHNNAEKWRNPQQWKDLIHERGERIFRFMLEELVGASENSQVPSDDTQTPNPQS